ncbi:hypothetical protein GY45DRAFT_1264999, partial [Cubamyces sp. BRFM 1775]
YPNPDDVMFSLKTPCLTHLSLRDEPRYYLYLRNEESVLSSFTAPILKASKCLAILRKMDAPLLSSLELVYEGNAGEAELLRHMPTAYPCLTQLELHKHRASDDDCDPYVSLATTLSSMTTLRTLHLNLDCAQIPPVHCNDEEKYDVWSEFLDNQAQEVLSIMRTCPCFEYVAFLDPRRQFATWIEYRPAWYPRELVDVDFLGIQRL